MDSGPSHPESDNEELPDLAAAQEANSGHNSTLAHSESSPRGDLSTHDTKVDHQEELSGSDDGEECFGEDWRERVRADDEESPPAPHHEPRPRSPAGDRNNRVARLSRKRPHLSVAVPSASLPNHSSPIDDPHHQQPQIHLPPSPLPIDTTHAHHHYHGNEPPHPNSHAATRRKELNKRILMLQSDRNFILDSSDAASIKTDALSEITPSQMDPANDTFSNFTNKKPVLLPHIGKKVNNLRKKNIHTEIYVSDKLCFIVPQTNLVRRLCAKFILSPHIERFIILLILVNTILLALYDPLNPESIRNAIVSYSEIFFIVVYGIEMILKIISLGWIGYFKDKWNVLDFLIILGGILSFFTWISALSALRLVRVLRPLRALVLIPDLRILVQAFLSSIDLLANALFLFVLFLWLFSIIGLHLFHGTWHQFCYNDLTNEILDSSRLCTLEPARVGVIQGRLCPEGYTCRERDLQFSYGFQNFDSLPFSMLSVLQSITLEEWLHLSSHAADALGELSRIYFICVVFFGSLFVMNLVLGITNDSFRKFQPFAQAYQDEKNASKFTRLLNKIDVCYSRIKCPSIYQKFQERARIFLFSTPVKLFVGTMIFLNTVALALQHYGISSTMTLVLDILNITFLVFFTVELVVKFVILGPRDFFKEKFNVFDAVVVLLSLIEIPFWGSSILSVLRILRLFRVLRLFGTFRGLQRIVNAISKSMLSAFFLTSLFALFVLYFSLMGMQLFGGRLGATRTNFDNIFNAAVTVFIVITRDDWSEINYQAMWRVNPAACIYFVILVLGGGFVVINLFVSVLIQHVSAEPDDLKPDASHDSPSLWSIFMGFLWRIYRRLFRVYTTYVYRILLGRWAPDAGSIIPLTSSARSTPLDDVPPPFGMSTSTFDTPTNVLTDPKHHQRTLGNSSKDKHIGPGIEQQHEHPTEETDDLPKLSVKRSTIRERIVRYLTHDPLQYDRSLFIFPPSLWIRRRLVALVKHPYFEGLLVCIIFVSSVSLAFETPFRDPVSLFSTILGALSMFFALFFALEVVVKILLFGLILHPTAYLRSMWNVLDCIIAIADVSTTFFFTNNLGNVQVLRLLRTLRILRGFRTLRALRVLRLFNKIEGLRRLVDGLLASVRTLGYVGLVAILIYTVFAVLGVNLFGGCFYSCTNDSFITRQSCIDAGHTWKNARSHFDNFGSAFLTLFEMATLDGWSKTLWNMMDTTHVDEAPRYMASPWFAVYAITFILFGSFFMLSLFVGVIIDTTKVVRRLHRSRIKLTDTEERWLSIRHRMQNISSSYWPQVPKQKWRIKLYLFFKSTFGETLVLLLVLTNSIFMSLETYGQSNTTTQVLSIASTTFSVVFTVEVCAKFIVYGPLHYLQDDWLYVIIQVLSVVGTILKYALGTSSLATNVFRTFRIFRLLRLLKRGRGIRALSNSLYSAISGLVYTSFLLALFVFIYSIMGFSLFARASRLGAQVLSDRTNFDSLWHSMLAIFALSTGEHWVGLMHDYIEIGDSSSVYCSPKRGDCVAPPYVTIIFFCSFILVGLFILIQLFSAIVVNNFVTVRDKEETLTDEDIKYFIVQWSKIDRNLSLFIPVVKLPRLLLLIGSPLGVEPGAQIHSRLKYILSNLRVRVYIDEIHFYDTLKALAELKFGAELPLEIQDEVDHRWNALIRGKSKLRKRTLSPPQFSLPDMRMLFFSKILDEENHEELPQTGLKWKIVQYIEHKTAMWRLRGDSRIAAPLVGLSSSLLLDVNSYEMQEQLNTSDDIPSSPFVKALPSPLKNFADQFLQLATIIPEEDVHYDSEEDVLPVPVRRSARNVYSHQTLPTSKSTFFFTPKLLLAHNSKIRKSVSNPMWISNNGGSLIDNARVIDEVEGGSSSGSGSVHSTSAACERETWLDEAEATAAECTSTSHRNEKKQLNSSSVTSHPSSNNPTSDVPLSSASHGDSYSSADPNTKLTAEILLKALQEHDYRRKKEREENGRDSCDDTSTLSERTDNSFDSGQLRERE